MPDFEASSFDPVLLDLRDINDYMVLVAAMSDYAAQLEHEADEDEKDARRNGEEGDRAHVVHNREWAARLNRLIDDIERQLDANSAARREAGGGS
ncbi:hypothetical protein [Microbacterium lacticum]